MPIRVLLLWLLYCLNPLPVLAAPQLYTRGVETGPALALGPADLRWLWEKRHLNLGVIGRDNPPFDMLGTGQAYEGISAEYASVLAEKLGLTSIAFPAISCGVFGYPLHQAAHIAATETLTWQRSHREPQRIILVAYNAATFKVYQQALAALGQPVEVAGPLPPLAAGMELPAAAPQ
ncbi:O-acetyl-ADP-ribose deacetylase [compost metagenome]